MQLDTDFMLNLITNAGDIALTYYNKPTNTTTKISDISDGFTSPLTDADIAVQTYIIAELQKKYGDIKIISEEQLPEENQAALSSRHIFVIDPIDGTKEFIKRTGEFTINIGLLSNLKPTEGYVYAPAIDQLYFTRNQKAYRRSGGRTSRINPSKYTKAKNIVASKNHMDLKTKKFIEQFEDAEILQAGSSLKLCKIADGSADIYPRLAPNSMEWDTAAADAILRSSNARICDDSGGEFQYGKAELRNTGFIAYAPNINFRLN